MKCPHCGGDADRGCCFANWEDRVDEQFARVFPWMLLLGIGAFAFLAFVIGTHG